MKTLLAFFVLGTGILQAHADEQPLICFVEKLEYECGGYYKVYSRVESIKTFHFSKELPSNSEQEQHCITFNGPNWTQYNASLPSKSESYDAALATAMELKWDGYCRSVITYK